MAESHIARIERDAQALYAKHGHSPQPWADIRGKEYWRRVADLLCLGYSENDAAAFACGLKEAQVKRR